MSYYNVPPNVESIADSPEFQEDWQNLLHLLALTPEEKEQNKVLIDQLFLEISYHYMGFYDPCGLSETLADTVLERTQGYSLEELLIAEFDLADDADVSALLPYGQPDYGITPPDPAILEDMTQRECSQTDGARIFSSLFSFSSCSGFDLFGFMLAYSDAIVDPSIACINRFLTPRHTAMSMCQGTEADPHHFERVMDACLTGVVGDNVLGQAFRLFMATPELTCGCMSFFDFVPDCTITVGDLAIEGETLRKASCSMSETACPIMRKNCEAEITAFEQCLPQLEEYDNEDDINCVAVMCDCEEKDASLFNYPDKMIQLPMSDMCAIIAEDTVPEQNIPDRYNMFRYVCGGIPLPSSAPSAAPSITASTEPTAAPSEDAVAVFIRASDDSPNGMSVGTIFNIIAGLLGLIGVLLALLLFLYKRGHRSTREYPISVADEHEEEEDDDH